MARLGGLLLRRLDLYRGERHLHGLRGCAHHFDLPGELEPKTAVAQMDGGSKVWRLSRFSRKFRIFRWLMLLWVVEIQGFLGGF